MDNVKEYISCINTHTSAHQLCLTRLRSLAVEWLVHLVVKLSRCAFQSARVPEKETQIGSDFYENALSKLHVSPKRRRKSGLTFIKIQSAKKENPQGSTPFWYSLSGCYAEDGSLSRRSQVDAKRDRRTLLLLTNLTKHPSIATGRAVFV